MATFVAATIASKRFLALARVTAASFREHHPEIPFCVLLTDEDQGRFDPGGEAFRTVRLDELPIEEPVGFRFQYSELELSYASTPYLIDFLLREGHDGVLFLKQETLVLGSLAMEFEKLKTHSVLLTPHLLEPASGADAVEREINVLRAGVFNGGFLGFSGHGEARRVLAWWQRKVKRDCFRAVEQGIHFEQRWLDFVPSLAPGAHVLRDPGLNVGHWNLPERKIRVSGNRITADGAPCRVFRFSGYQPERPHMVTRYNPHLTVASLGDAAEVFARYQAMLDGAGYREMQVLPYAYGVYDNGEPIEERARRIYHDLNGEAERFGDPFAASGEASFYHWVSAGEAQAERGGER